MSAPSQVPEDPSSVAGHSFAAPLGSAYWPLFQHMFYNHGLALLDSEMDEICQVADEMRSPHSR